MIGEQRCIRMQMWLDKRYHSLDYEMKHRYGRKLYKIALDGGFTCPNRDGTLGNSGCIFCSAGGSGDFAGERALSVTEQISEGKKLLEDKYSGGGYIAYFQAFTGTYAPPDRLRALYMEAIMHPEVEILAIATRPDCLPGPVLDLLTELNRIKPVWIELGLQTIHPKSAGLIRRGYDLPVFESAVNALSARGIETIVHVILGIPGETKEDMIATAAYLAALPVSGIKFQLLHVLKGTDLYDMYMRGEFETLSLEAYTDILLRCLEVLPPEIVIHRVTGDGPRGLLAAPLWSLQKKKVLNHIQHMMKEEKTYQGRYAHDGN